MSDQRHLAVLHDGVATWNRWRHENSDIVPDLSGARLPGSDFTSCNFSRCILNGVRFENCNLTLADFAWAELSGAVFVHTNLTETNFDNANLLGTKFENVHNVPATVMDFASSPEDASNPAGSTFGTSARAPKPQLIGTTIRVSRYPTLIFVQAALQFVAWTVMILGILGSLMILSLQTDAGPGSPLRQSPTATFLLAGQVTLSSIVTGVLLLALAEFLTLMMDLEENSRLTRLLLARQSEEKS